MLTVLADLAEFERELRARAMGANAQKVRVFGWAESQSS
jgi:hypothetical protein